MVTVRLPMHDPVTGRKDGRVITLYGVGVYVPSEAAKKGVIRDSEVDSYHGRRIIVKDGSLWASVPPDEITIVRGK